MRFLDTRTGAFVERDPEETRFAILSHTWVGDEQSYTELREIQKRCDLKVQCPLHGTKKPAQPSPSPERLLDTSPLPIPTEGSSGASAETPLKNPSESHANEITTPSRSLHTMEGGDPQDDASAMTNARGSRLSRSLNTLFEFVLLVFLLPAFLL